MWYRRLLSKMRYIESGDQKSPFKSDSKQLSAVRERAIFSVHIVQYRVLELLSRIFVELFWIHVWVKLPVRVRLIITDIQPLCCFAPTNSRALAVLGRWTWCRRALVFSYTTVNFNLHLIWSLSGTECQVISISPWWGHFPKNFCRAMPSCGVCLSARPSVCPWRSGITYQMKTA